MTGRPAVIDVAARSGTKRRRPGRDRPGDASLAFNLGLLLAERGKLDEAEEMLEASLAAGPRWRPPPTTSP